MARSRGKLADVQRKLDIFTEYCDEIKDLGVDKIVDKGLVSRTTLYVFMRRSPVNQTTEDAIIKSVIACRNDRAEERKKRQSFAAQALTA